MLPFKFPDRYEFIGQKLEGGQGCVYVCRDRFLDRRVAIKVVNSTASILALKKELAVLTEIRSKHIAEIYDILEAKSGKQIGLVQQFVPGKHLSEIANEELSREHFLAVIYQLACGLSDIHKFQKVHRDIKPENARFDDEKVLKILDFGLSAHASGEAKTSHGHGTQFFIAPELWGASPFVYTSAVDVYAFGVTCWVLAHEGKLAKTLKAEPPLSGGGKITFAYSKLQLSAEVVTLLDNTLSAKPVKRPTMPEVKSILERRLLFGKHRAAIWFKGQTSILDMPQKAVVITSGTNSITISYNGLHFVISAVQGDVYINNSKAMPTVDLPGSCVVTMGSGNSRQFGTVDMSHPGVMF